MLGRCFLFIGSISFQFSDWRKCGVGVGVKIEIENRNRNYNIENRNRNIISNIQYNIMKNYSSLGTSPTTNYIRFKDEGGGSGRGGGLGGLADNLALLGFEKHDERKSREIIGNSGDNKSIIQNGSVGDGDVGSGVGEVVYKTIVIPFYYCLIDIVINNDLYVEIVDNGNAETKNIVLASGKIRKYRLNSAIKDYDIFVELENENVFRVNKRGIMMRIKVSEELRRLIINTMVNFVADGGDVDARKKSGGSGGGVAGGGGDRGGGGGKDRGGCLGWFSCFRASRGIIE